MPFYQLKIDFQHTQTNSRSSSASGKLDANAVSVVRTNIALKSAHAPQQSKNAAFVTTENRVEDPAGKS